MTRGGAWLDALAGGSRAVDGVPSLRFGDVVLGDVPLRAFAIVPDAQSPYPRARGGELGVREARALAAAIDAVPRGSGVLAIVDVPGQAFGYREEVEGIHAALAACIAAYATARERAPLLALVVGKAISGAFLAHGLQAAWIGALRDPRIEVHVMSAASVARVTRTDDDGAAPPVPAAARDVETFAHWGALAELIDVANADAPSSEDVAHVRARLATALSATGGSPLARLRARDPATTVGAVMHAIRAAW